MVNSRCGTSIALLLLQFWFSLPVTPAPRMLPRPKACAGALNMETSAPATPAAPQPHRRAPAGPRGRVLPLSTREQHIRREKATSNICTAQVLLAVMASMYAVFHGPKGLKAIAQQVHQKTVLLAKGLEKLGYAVEPETFFDTITVEVGHMQGLVMRAAVAEGVNLRKVGETKVGISLDERTRPAILEAVWRAFGGSFKVAEFEADYRLPTDLLRTSDYLTHPIFHMNRAESEMTRYIRRLSDRDLALDRSMIPLGSCTMKLNATTEMLPVTWPEFGQMPPLAPGGFVTYRLGFAFR
eukprot:gene35975-48392_t